MGLIEKLFAGLQYLIPHHLISRLAHRIACSERTWLKNTQIFLFTELVDVDLSECPLQSVADYPSFNTFFTRELKPGARPPDPDPAAFVSPSDGSISAAGRIQDHRLIQAKGESYTVSSLLASDPLCNEFSGGYFYTIYLSPRDYHRVHMPLDGKLLRALQIPGRLFSVAPYTVRQIPNLFVRNERLACLFETSRGPLAVVMVGAMLVSGIETVWSGPLVPPRKRRVIRGEYAHHDIRLRRGDEMGRFNFGSTVILLLSAGAVSSRVDIETGDPVIVGQKLGRLS